MCINKKHKKQNLPITPETEKDDWKVVLLYFFGLGRQSGWIKEGDRHWNHFFCYSFCFVCSASNQSIKINFCAQSDTRWKPQSPSTYSHPTFPTHNRTSADPSNCRHQSLASKFMCALCFACVFGFVLQVIAFRFALPLLLRLRFGCLFRP